MDATRLAYLTLILGSLFLNKDPGQAPELQSRDLGDLFASLEEQQPWRDSDWDANAEPVLEASPPWRFVNTFLPPASGASCLSRRLLLACFSGLLRILWSRLGNWRATGRRPRAEVESNPEQDLVLARRSPACYALPVPASTSTSGECLSSGLDSYELPWERPWHTSFDSSSSPSSDGHKLKGCGWTPDPRTGAAPAYCYTQRRGDWIRTCQTLSCGPPLGRSSPSPCACT
ncbi:uncharacterized protein LOC140702499 [Pogona vitticeps]